MFKRLRCKGSQRTGWQAVRALRLLLAQFAVLMHGAVPRSCSLPQRSMKWRPSPHKITRADLNGNTDRGCGHALPTASSWACSRWERGRSACPASEAAGASPHHHCGGPAASCPQARTGRASAGCRSAVRQLGDETDISGVSSANSILWFLCGPPVCKWPHLAQAPVPVGPSRHRNTHDLTFVVPASISLVSASALCTIEETCAQWFAGPTSSSVERPKSCAPVRPVRKQRRAADVELWSPAASSSVLVSAKAARRAAAQLRLLSGCGARAAVSDRRPRGLATLTSSQPPTARRQVRDLA